MLKQDGWVQDQLSAVEKQNHGFDKLAKLEQQKILQAQTRMAKVREGFEGGLYNLEEAKSKVSAYRDTRDKAEQEIKRLAGLVGGRKSVVDIEELRKQLERLAQANLDKATFTEKQDIINKLGVRVYPSEDLKAMKVRCSLNFRNGSNGPSSDKCVIVQFASLRSQ